VNSDGRIDLLSAPEYPTPIQVFLSNGDGTFSHPATFPTGPAAHGMDVEDLNGDGLVDIATANSYSGTSGVYLGMGTGAFTRGVDYPAQEGPSSVAVGDLNGDGRPDLAIANERSNTISIRWNQGESHAPRVARAFLPGDVGVLSAAADAPETQFRIEPVGGAYANENVYLPSIAMESPGTGSISRIFALSDDPSLESDQDGNGVMELPVRFASRDISRLFSRIDGMTTVDATLSGFLETGEAFRAAIRFRVMGEVGALRAFVAPSPSFGQSTIYVSTARFGPLRIRLFDVRGRLVRTLLDERFAPAGLHMTKIDGSGRGGAALPSGLYFYQVDGAGGIRTGRLAILR